MRAWLYDRAILPVTAVWYAEVLRRLPERARLLDVGIGTGGALIANAALLREKRLQIHGVDIDIAYLRRCRRALRGAGLDAQVHVAAEPIERHLGGPYDAAYFSGSFMLLPNPAAALRHVGTLLAPGGLVYFTQTFEHQRSALAERIKPLLRRLTTIDFGRVTYTDAFRRSVEQGGADLIELTPLRPGRRRSQCLAVARPHGA